MLAERISDIPLGFDIDEQIIPTIDGSDIIFYATIALIALAFAIGLCLR